MQVQTHFMLVHAKCILIMHVFGMFFGMKLYQFAFMPHSCKYKLISCSFMPSVFLLCMFLACFWHEAAPVRVHAAFMPVQKHCMFVSCQVYSYYACFWHETVSVCIHAAFMQVQTHFILVHACQLLMFVCMELYQFANHASTISSHVCSCQLYSYNAYMYAFFRHEAVPVNSHSCKYKLISCQVYSFFLIELYLKSNEY
jgi:hypothetical protein